MKSYLALSSESGSQSDGCSLSQSYRQENAKLTEKYEKLRQKYHRLKDQFDEVVLQKQLLEEQNKLLEATIPSQTSSKSAEQVIPSSQVAHILEDFDGLLSSQSDEIAKLMEDRDKLSSICFKCLTAISRQEISLTRLQNGIKRLVECVTTGSVSCEAVRQDFEGIGCDVTAIMSLVQRSANVDGMNMLLASGAGHNVDQGEVLRILNELPNIPFQGEPLSGLQIMGILETRALDFDRLIILSANEGVFPAKKTANTFIPYNLRRGFGLPTYEHQDGIWAYHFYRLLYRSKEVKLIYDTRNNGLQTGEVSRFVHQLRYHYQVPLLDTLITYNIAPGKSHTLSINKTDTVLSKLEMFKREGEKSLSASAINTYIDCPLKFYFSYIEDIKEEDEISETVESNLFGSILHRVMEHIYQPLCGRSIDSECLKNIRKDKQRIEHLIEASFAELFFKTENIRPLTGQNYLVGSMIYKYVDKILEEDAKLSPFTYIKSEKLIRSSICLNDGTSVFLKGFIDRIDRINGISRIVDYKSGTGKSDFKNVDSLFDSSEKNRSKAVMQVFLYAMMYKGLFNSATIEPHIYYVRTLFNRFDSHIYHHVERGKNIPVNNYDDYAETFENGLRACLDKIFDKSTPFQQTEDTQYCSYCQFRAICGR